MSVPPLPWVHPDILRSWIFGGCHHPGCIPDTRRKRGRLRGLDGPALTLCLLLLTVGCADRQDRLRTFAYYALPSLLPLGNLLQFSYLHDGDPADIRAVEENIDVKRKTIHLRGLIERCGARLYRDLRSAKGKK